ncbi:MAG TPA: hypothetical protein VGJ32_15475 [Solirubrobacteraceae bacterium]
MPEPLPDPPVDRTGWWRSPPPPSNPDEVVAGAGRRLSVRQLVALAWGMALLALVVLVALIALEGPLAGSAESALFTLIPLLVFGGFASVLLVVGSTLLEEYRRPRREQAARERIAAWAGGAGLRYTPSGDLPEATPLLRRGDRRFARNLAAGELPGGLPGILAGYVYEVEQGDDDYEAHPNTVVVARLPETLGFLPELTVEPRDGWSVFDRVEDVARRRRRIEMESIALARRFEIFVRRDEDEIWVRRLFAPSFVDWLAERAPEALRFELRDGILCVALPREVTDPAYLEAFCRTASYVAARFRQESLEAARRPAATRFAQRPVAAAASGPVAALGWAGAPPPDVTTASRPFVPTVARQARTWRAPLISAAIGFVAAAAWLSDDEDSSSLEVPSTATLVIAGIVALVVLALAARVAIRRRAQEYGKEAFWRAYGRARDLVAEEPRAFHARQVNANLPGAAEFVLSGPLPGLGAPGSLVLCGDQARGSKSSEYEALVAPAGDDRLATLRLAAGAPLPADLAAALGPDALGRRDGVGPLALSREGGALVVCAERSRKAPLSAAELDAFVERAARLARAARGLAV